MEFDEPPVIVAAEQSETKFLRLDKEIIGKLLENSKLPFIVLSIIGNPASGKSFLFNYILRYLKSNGNGKWMGAPDEVLDGFPWNQGDDEEDRNGIRIYHEVVDIKDENEDAKLQLILLDIDFFVDPNKEESAIQYAALESFCLSVSNVVVYIDSNVKHQETLNTVHRLNEQIKKSTSTHSVHVKYVVYENLNDPTETVRTVPMVLKHCETTTLAPYQYSAVKLPSFKGEYKHISSLKNFKSLILNCFPINELLQFLDCPDQLYRSSVEVIHRFQNVINLMNNSVIQDKLPDCTDLTPDISDVDKMDTLSTSTEQPDTTNTHSRLEPNLVLDVSPEQAVQNLVQEYSDLLEKSGAILDADDADELERLHATLKENVLSKFQSCDNISYKQIRAFEKQLSSSIDEVFNEAKSKRKERVAVQIRLQKCIDETISWYRSHKGWDHNTAADRRKAIGSAIQRFQNSMCDVDQNILKIKTLELKNQLMKISEEDFLQEKSQKAETKQNEYLKEKERLIEEYKVKMTPLLENAENPESIHEKYVDYIRRTAQIPIQIEFDELALRFKSEFEKLVNQSPAKAIETGQTEKLPYQPSLDQNLPSSCVAQYPEIIYDAVQHYQQKLTEFINNISDPEAQLEMFCNELELSGLQKIQIAFPGTEQRKMAVVEFKDKLFVPYSTAKAKLQKKCSAFTTNKFKELTHYLQNQHFENKDELTVIHIIKCIESYHGSSVDNNLTIEDFTPSGTNSSEIKPSDLARMLLEEYNSKMRLAISEMNDVGINLQPQIEILHEKIRTIVTSKFRPSNKYPFFEYRKAENELYESIQRSFSIFSSIYKSCTQVPQTLAESDSDWRSSTIPEQESITRNTDKSDHDPPLGQEPRCYLPDEIFPAPIPSNQEVIMKQSPFHATIIHEIPIAESNFVKTLVQKSEKEVEAYLNLIQAEVLSSYKTDLQNVNCTWVDDKVSNSTSLEAKKIAEEAVQRFVARAASYETVKVNSIEQALKRDLKRAFDNYVAKQKEQEDILFIQSKFELLKDYRNEMRKYQNSEIDLFDAHTLYVRSKLDTMEFKISSHAKQLRDAYQQEFHKLRNRGVPEYESITLPKISMPSRKQWPSLQNVNMGSAAASAPNAIKKLNQQNPKKYVNREISTLFTPFYANQDYRKQAQQYRSQEVELSQNVLAKNKKLTDAECNRILQTRITAYEEQMLVYFQENTPEAILKAKHKIYKDSAMKLFRNSTSEDLLSKTYESILTAKIDSRFEERLRLLRTEANQKNKQATTTVASSDPTNLTTSLQRESKAKQAIFIRPIPRSANGFQEKLRLTHLNADPQKFTIGVHLGRSKIRCSTFKDDQFHHIPLQGLSYSLPAYLGIKYDDSLILGSGAKSLLAFDPAQVLVLKDLKVGPEYNLRFKKGLSFEISVAVFLKYIYKTASEILKADIENVVITVPSLSDHVYKQSVCDAARLADIDNFYLVSECSSIISGYIYKNSSNLREGKSIMLAYQRKKNDLEAAYFKVNGHGATQLSISGKHYADCCSSSIRKSVRKRESWFGRWMGAMELNGNLANTTIDHTQVFKNVLLGANRNDVDTMLVVGNQQQSTIPRQYDFKNTEDIDSKTGFIEGASYYAHSLTTSSPILLQECLSYDLQYEFNGQKYIIFPKFTQLPNQAKVQLSNGSDPDSIAIKLHSYFSENYSHHTETLSVSKIKGTGLDSVEFTFELDAQGILKVRAELVEAIRTILGRIPNKKSVNIDVLFTKNLDKIKFQKSKEFTSHLFDLLRNTDDNI